MQNYYFFFEISGSATNGYLSLSLNFLDCICIFTAICVIVSKNPIVSILFLIGLFLGISCHLLISGANLIGLSYLFVYVGAIVITINGSQITFNPPKPHYFIDLHIKSKFSHTLIKNFKNRFLSKLTLLAFIVVVLVCFSKNLIVILKELDLELRGTCIKLAWFGIILNKFLWSIIDTMKEEKMLPHFFDDVDNKKPTHLCKGNGTTSNSSSGPRGGASSSGPRGGGASSSGSENNRGTVTIRGSNTRGTNRGAITGRGNSTNSNINRGTTRGSTIYNRRNIIALPITRSTASGNAITRGTARGNLADTILGRGSAINRGTGRGTAVGTGSSSSVRVPNSDHSSWDWLRGERTFNEAHKLTLRGAIGTLTRSPPGNWTLDIENGMVRFNDGKTKPINTDFIFPYIGFNPHCDEGSYNPWRYISGLANINALSKPSMQDIATCWWGPANQPPAGSDTLERKIYDTANQAPHYEWRGDNQLLLDRICQSLKDQEEKSGNTSFNPKMIPDHMKGFFIDRCHHVCPNEYTKLVFEDDLNRVKRRIVAWDKITNNEDFRKRFLKKIL